MKQVMELRRINTAEFAVLREALELLAKSGGRHDWGAKAMLEDDLEFVRGLFWTSKQEAAK